MAAEEQLVFDGLTLNDSTFGLVTLVCPPPRERPEWIGAADAEAQLLARAPLHENRDITVTLSISTQVDMNTALDKIGLLVDKCVKASKYQDGIALTWTPATSTRTVTFDVLSAEITDLPVDWDGGWLAKAPTVTIAMKAKPYWRGTEVLTSATSSSTPVVTAELVNNSGDVPALGRLIVTDTATQSRRHVEWGLEGPLTYNASTALLLDSDSLVTSGFAGAQTTKTGAYDANATGNSIISSPVYLNTPVAICGTGNLSHVGAFRVKARVFADTYHRFRLSWQAGDGTIVSNPWAAPNGPPGGSYFEIDLGTVSIPTVTAGTQRWTGRVEAYQTDGTAASSSFIWVDYLILVPVSAGYGKARATYAYSPGVITGIDDFTGTTAGSALNGRTAVAGGTWATSGATTDLSFADDLSGEQVKRTSASGARYALLGSAVTNTQVQVSVYRSGNPTTAQDVSLGALARWVDNSNHLRAVIENSTGPTAGAFSLVQTVAGTETYLGSVTVAPATTFAQWVRVHLIVVSSGRAIAQLYSAAGAVLAEIDTTSSALASGALASGSSGFYDNYTSAGALARYYDDVSISSPPAEPIVVYSGRNMQIRHDDTIRQDSTGTFTGRPQSYRGSRFLVPVGTSRLLVKARRNDIDATSDDNVTDATQIQIGVTPRGLVIPR